MIDTSGGRVEGQVGGCWLEAIRAETAGPKALSRPQSRATAWTTSH